MLREEIWLAGDESAADTKLLSPKSGYPENTVNAVFTAERMLRAEQVYRNAMEIS
jgi:hypothetical protein